MRVPVMLATLALVPVLATGQHLNVDVDGPANQLRITPPRLLRPCDLGLLVAQVGHALKLPVGFENTRECPLTFRGPAEGAVEDLSGKSPRDVFDYLVTFYPEFSWKDIDDVIVVRPKAAWDDPRDVLNFRTASFASTDKPLDDAVHRLLRAVMPSAFVPHDDLADPERPINRRVTIVFRGGTMLEALNAIVRSREDLDWQLGYYAGPGHADLQLGTSDSAAGLIGAGVAFPK